MRGLGYRNGYRLTLVPPRSGGYAVAASDRTGAVRVDAPTFDSLIQQYRTYRVIADGIPAGQVTLPLVDSGCRGIVTPAPSTVPRLPAGYDISPECQHIDNATMTHPGSRAGLISGR